MPNIYQQDFWNSEDDELWEEIAALMLSVYLSGIDGGISALPSNIRVLADFDKLNQSALEFAKNYRYQWIKGITDTTRQQTQKAVSDWISSGAPLDALETALESVYGSARAERIAITEVGRVYAQANAEAFESTGLVDEVVWETVSDDRICPVCEELDGTTIGVGDLDALPPAHPGCRCRIQPRVSEEALERRLEEALA